ncbi:MAG: hypothetical protein ACR2KW_07795 [Rubrobacter sp.]
MQETKPGKTKAALERLSPGTAFCAAPAGGGTAVGGSSVESGPMGSAELFGSITLSEALPLTLAFVAFLAVGMWMFHRWGNTLAPQAPLEDPAVEVAGVPEEERERELINA